MAAGDLSADQRTYVSSVVRGTGLDRDVVVAWVGAESGWNVTKPSHNYLNVGPGERYSSTAGAAARAVALITTSSHYAGIRKAITSRDPVAQVRAIEASPWDAAGYSGGRLMATYESVVRAGGGTVDARSDGRSSSDDGGPDPEDLILGPVAAWIVDQTDGEGIAGRAIRSLLGGLVPVALTVVFVVAALALIALGLYIFTKPEQESVKDAAGRIVGLAAAAKGA